MLTTFNLACHLFIPGCKKRGSIQEVSQMQKFAVVIKPNEIAFPTEAHYWMNVLLKSVMKSLSFTTVCSMSFYIPER
eukprot:scaffold422827_cov63-Attheya_sp.AAC.2